VSRKRFAFIALQYPILSKWILFATNQSMVGRAADGPDIAEHKIALYP
jgi:hypothetical protein